jgi:DNA gyrase inhibitor GyrI
VSKGDFERLTLASPASVHILFDFSTRQQGDDEMKDLQVRIETLPPMRVASAYGFGTSPEGIAFDLMEAWARPKGLMEDNPTYGFDNPSPTPGSPNYGYEVWLPVGPEVEPEGGIKIIDFPGGLYAVAPCEGVQVIGERWKALVHWREGSKYQCGHHQWLEKLLTPVTLPEDQLVFDLYLPISE